MRLIVKPDPWLPYRRPTLGPRVRLFCFPHAGGGATVYRGWDEALPATVEVCAVQLPGREGRRREAAVTALTELVPMIADGLAPHLTPPFAFFGHSMGATLAFELARELRRRRRPGPAHLFVSACRPPHIADTDATHELPDAALIERLRALGGMSDEVLAHSELMELILSLFRADAALTETYTHTEEAPLDAPITAFGGLEDPKATQAEMAAWGQHTRGVFALAMVPGGHFYLRGDGRAPVLGAIARALAAIVA